MITSRYVAPAKAGVQRKQKTICSSIFLWIPSFEGMTSVLAVFILKLKILLYK